MRLYRNKYWINYQSVLHLANIINGTIATAMQVNLLHSCLRKPPRGNRHCARNDETCQVMSRQPSHNASITRSLTPILRAHLLVYPVLQQRTNRGRFGHRRRRNGSGKTRGSECAQEKTGADGRAAHYGENTFCNNVQVLC